MKHSFIAIFLIALLVGCSTQRQQANQAKTDMVGMSKKDLFLCAGVPNRQEKVDDLEFLTYAGDEKNVGGAVAVSSSMALAVSHKKTCEATFVIKDDKIQQVNYKGVKSVVQ